MNSAVLAAMLLAVGCLLAVLVVVVVVATREQESEPTLVTLAEVSRTTDSSGNIMILLTEQGKYSEQELIDYCRYIKRNPPGKRFVSVVVFDDASNAKFPANPFTAGFGMDWDTMTHIRAMYELNTVNGFSELKQYSDSMYNGKPVIFKIL